MTAEEILSNFYESIEFNKGKYGWNFKADLNFYKGKVLNYSIFNPSTGKLVLEKGTKVTQRIINETLKKKNKNLFY